MKIKIDREDLFKEKLQSGINLFTGAGFSCLPDEEGNQLPVANELCQEICKKFDLSYETFGNDLESISTLADGDEYQSFLRNKFKVSQINKKYLLLNRIKILAFVTTNIDNIVHLAVEQGERYFLESITYYGAIRKEYAALCYIPLHGEVMNQEKHLYFGKYDLATADRSNSDLFQQATLKLRGTPTIFWGYGFHDSGVLKTVKKLLENGPQDIWVQCRESDKKQIALFENLGCNIIVAETDELFDWIDGNTTEKNLVKESGDIQKNSNLKSYFIPTINQVPAVQATDYFIKGITQWYSIFAKQAIELDIVNDTYNIYLKNKNTIIIGTDFSGKTTALMQLALKLNVKNKLFVSNLTPEKSKFIINNIGKAEVTIFIDNCETDMLAYKILAQAENIFTIATATDYTFEASKHLLEGTTYKPIFIKDFTKEQARRFYNSIDESIRQNVFKYKNFDAEKYSILEMMLKNIKNSLGRKRIKELLLKVLHTSKSAFDTVALAIYLSGNHSALSTDILFSYFHCKTYQDTLKYVNDANGLLRELDISVDQCNDDQDYYDVRSKLFLYHGKKLFSEQSELKNAYASTISNFLKEVSPYKIYQYHLFRRSAYDAKLFYDLFKKDANNKYEMLYNYSNNPYTLQQWALCRAYLKEFKEAFADIDKAQRQKPGNFSIRNTSAIILFEANRDDKSEIGYHKRKEAIEILENCYSNDKRKVYHANRFAEFAIEIAKLDNDYQYIEKAITWLNEIVDKGEVISGYTKKYLFELNEIWRLRMGPGACHLTC
ncbi:SIR2 family protein [Acetobacterium wieringae]|uniref:SIR2 family protein n=1 Tax=Acetobacterium wieringae TaxID=52694 RepID=A0ABY6HCG1_9FIRM|nr:SIR2 family protein [Acetobacterium wieringae]UYO62189.1 SIR2 family protein [Acetobacterium wieringae]VUZ26085.1 Uncharacterised protein [Acetobacterium wieringae]